MSFLAPSKAEVQRRRLLVGGASFLLTAILMTGFLLESRWGYSPKDMNLIFVQSWPADRSRDDTLADTKATEAAREARLAESRAYIATLSGPARVKAQEEYDRYVAGNGVRKDIPFVMASRPAATAAAASAAEPPVL